MTLSRVLALLAICGTSAACATQSGPAPIRTVTVNVAVPVACTPPGWKAAAAHVTDAQLAAFGTPPAGMAARYEALAEFYRLYAPVLDADEKMLANCQSAAK